MILLKPPCVTIISSPLIIPKLHPPIYGRWRDQERERESERDSETERERQTHRERFRETLKAWGRLG